MPPHDRSARLHELSPYPVPVPEGILTKSGLPSTSTFLRGDGVWATPPAGTSLRPATIVIAASDSKHAGADYVCTGTDDDVTINTAIAEIDGAPKGGSILFLDGTYSLGHKIVSPARGGVPGYVLRGSGASKIQAQDPATFPDDCFLEIEAGGTNPQGADCVTLIQGLCFDQTNATGADLASTSAIKCGGGQVQGLVIEDCSFSNLQGHAIYVQGAVIRIRRNFFGNCQQAESFTPFDVDDGVILGTNGGGVFMLWIEDNDFANYGNLGLDINVSDSNVTITGNAFGYTGGVLLSRMEIEPSNQVVGNSNLALKVTHATPRQVSLVVAGNTGLRVALDGCQDFVISGNQLGGPDGNLQTADVTAANAIQLTDCIKGAVTGNLLNFENGMEGHGISLTRCSDINVSATTITPRATGGATHTYDGIFLDDDSNHNNVQGNLIREGTGSKKLNNGVTVNSVDCDDNLVTNNDLFGAWAGAAVNDSGTGTITAAGNRT